MAFSPSGTFLATGGRLGEVCVWRIEDGSLILSFPGESAVLCAVWEDPGDSRIFYGLQDGTIASVSISEVT